MEEKYNYRTDTFESGLLKNEPLAAECSKAEMEGGRPEPAPGAVQFADKRCRGPMAKRMAVGVIGALLVLFGMLATPATSSARVAIGISVNFGPPPLPVYAQPPCPGPGYIWTPGYWAWSPAYGYYWVPGTWVAAPFVGALWTPGYWGFSAGLYYWHPGYWGTRVGFYGGINYGFGYTGFGYHGGYWDHDRFYYNRAVNRIVGRNFRHVYYRREDEHFRGGRVSYNGGRGGVNVRPTRAQINAARYRRFGAVNQQLRHQRFARDNPRQRARVNHGRPEFAATPRAGEFRRFGNDRGNRSAPDRGQNRQRFQRARSNAAPSRQVQRRDPGRQHVQRRDPGRQHVQRSAPGRNFQRGPYQARQQEARGPQGRPTQERRGSAQHQERGNGGHGSDHGHRPGGGRH